MFINSLYLHGIEGNISLQNSTKTRIVFPRTICDWNGWLPQSIHLIRSVETFKLICILWQIFLNEHAYVVISVEKAQKEKDQI